MNSKHSNALRGPLCNVCAYVLGRMGRKSLYEHSRAPHVCGLLIMHVFSTDPFVDQDCSTLTATSPSMWCGVSVRAPTHLGTHLGTHLVRIYTQNWPLVYIELSLWPSGLRRYVQVVVSSGAWVRIPQETLFSNFHILE